MKIGLVGNQNSGKTTLFNLLTGMNAKIGNWPGVTIEKKTGTIKGRDYEITDLPGIYSLSPYSVEEEVSRRFIFEEKPDVIINIVDSTSLDRSLYLTTQLLELDTDVVIALNMADMLEKKGMSIDIPKLESALKVKVVKISALKETGIDELIKVLDEKKADKLIKGTHKLKKYDDVIESSICKIENELRQIQNENAEKIGLKLFGKNKLMSQLDSSMHTEFVAVKLLEEDLRFSNCLNENIKKVVADTKVKYKYDLEEEIATQRYNFIDKIVADVFKKKIIRKSVSDSLDKIFLNKWIAFPIFAVIMFCVYYLSVGVVGSFTVDFISNATDMFSRWIYDILTSINTSDMIRSLIVDGIIKGVGSVLSFVPQLIILFLCIAFLETTGYMSRIALLLDKLFRRLGLSGKSLIPFIVGSGCSVPGIMGTRIIENEDERKMTAILTPFIPCSAKLPIIALFTGYFFKENSGIVSASLYFFAIIVIIISALLMKKFVFKNTSSTYISELPEYKLPSAKYIFKDVWDKVIAFIKRAGSVILVSSIVVWFLLSFSFKLEYGVGIENSILAQIGNKISWIFYPILGTKSWGATVSTIQGLVAKEQVVSSMAIINGLAEDTIEGGLIFASSGVFGFFTAASAYAFMVFNLFSAPCFGAIGAMRRELGGTKKVLKAITFQTILAWCLGSLVYLIGSKLESGLIFVSDLIIGTIILLFILFIILSSGNKKNNECANCPYCSACEKK